MGEATKRLSDEATEGGRREHMADTAANGADGRTSEAQRAEGRAVYSWQAWLWFLVLAGAGVWLDLWTKAYAFPAGVKPFEVGGDFVAQGRHPFGPMVPVIPHVLGFQTIVNQGAVFGMAQGRQSLFIVFSIVALAVIAWVFMRSGARQRWLHTALGLITAGAIGNLYDRVTYPGVRDFLCFYTRYYPYIFNVADALLCVGVPILMLCWIWAEKHPDGGK